MNAATQTDSHHRKLIGQTGKWLSEGFHRIHAYREAAFLTVPCTVMSGGLRDAILLSVGSNADHGKRRSNADKRRSVELLLKDTLWTSWSDREIAKQCAVSHEFVRQARSICQPLTDTASTETVRTATRAGTTYTVKTNNIGKPKKVVSPIDSAIKLAISKVFDEMDGELSDEEGIDLAVSHILSGLDKSDQNIQAIHEKTSVAKSDISESYRELQQNEQRIVVCGKQFWPVTNFYLNHENPERTYAVVWGMGTFLEQLIRLLLSKGDTIESCAIWIMQHSRAIRLGSKESAAVLHSMASAINSKPELFKDNSATILPVTTSAPKEYYKQ